MSRWFHVYSTWLVRVVSEDDYALALEQLSDALPVEIAAVDRSGRVIVWNRAMEARGTPKAEALGRPLLEALPSLRERPQPRLGGRSRSACSRSA